jgi:hypothetical protein
VSFVVNELQKLESQRTQLDRDPRLHLTNPDGRNGDIAPAYRTQQSGRESVRRDLTPARRNLGRQQIPDLTSHGNEKQE